MKTSLSSFMVVALAAIIMVTLIVGTVFTALSNKHEQHQNALKQVHQLQKK